MFIGKFAHNYTNKKLVILGTNLFSFSKGRGKNQPFVLGRFSASIFLSHLLAVLTLPPILPRIDWDVFPFVSFLGAAAHSKQNLLSQNVVNLFIFSLFLVQVCKIDSSKVFLFFWQNGLFNTTCKQLLEFEMLVK